MSTVSNTGGFESTRAALAINLALQGGGSHGAFTWGVLDALLADVRVRPEGLSGTSAGAVNAVALASGWARAEAAGGDPREGARRALADFWRRIAGIGAIGALQSAWTDALWGFAFLPQPQVPPSPWQNNPLDLNPLLRLLESEIDFDAIASSPTLKVFVAATHVATGKAVVFAGAEVTARAVMASACLPTLYRAVEIDGEAYWDGGFSANPALAPLIDRCESADLLVVQLNPLRSADDTPPQTGAAIADRINELTFNASLLAQMRTLAAANDAADENTGGVGCRRVRVHRIDGESALRAFPASTKNKADPALIETLFAAGQDAGRAWLAKHLGDIGRRGTVNLQRDYLDDTVFAGVVIASPSADASEHARAPLPAPGPADIARPIVPAGSPDSVAPVPPHRAESPAGSPGPVGVRRFRPWLARQLKRLRRGNAAPGTPRRPR